MTDLNTDLDDQLRALGRHLDERVPPIHVKAPETHLTTSRRMAVAAIVLVVGLVGIRELRTDESAVNVSSAGPDAQVMESRVPIGARLGELSIPSVGLEVAVIEGDGRDQLRMDPGHDPQSAPIGSDGHAVITGYRTTFGAPFVDLDDLEPGDTIRFLASDGTTSEYVVQAQEQGAGFVIIHPSDLKAWTTGAPGTLSLVSTAPKFTSDQRIVVQAQLVEG